MTKCTTPSIEFRRLGRKKIEANFNGGDISSDGGLMLLRQVRPQDWIEQSRS